MLARLSLVSCIISAMPNEDKADIPAGWRDVVHPRRHGMIVVEPARDSGEDADRERVLDHPLTDPELAALTRLDYEKLAVDWCGKPLRRTRHSQCPR